MKKPTVLIIMDGYGLAEPSEYNAVSQANTKNLDKIFAENPTTQLNASGMSVGLPDGQMGNSEVGHINLGAGRVVYQPLTRITKSITDGNFFEIDEFIKAIDSAKANDTALHLLGLISDGGVHSHTDHLLALVKMARDKGLEKIYIHCFMDGRDVPPASGKDFIIELESNLKKLGAGKIASVSGRFYAMDRDNIWERVEIAYNCLVNGEGVTADTAEEAVSQSYAKNETDEFIKPTVVLDNNAPVATIDNDDSVIFFNFRPDRARQLTRALTEKDFDSFDRVYFDTTYVTMTTYDASFNNVLIAFKPQVLKNTLGEYLSDKGYTQLRIAETQKYAHVTYFFNGGEEKKYDGEDRILIDSPKIATFDAKPEMSAYEVTEAVLKEIEASKYDVIIMNYANCDMVGHTGIMDAAIAAVEAVDDCVGQVVDAIKAKGGIALITADHGNADKMFDTVEKEPFTAHTTNPVPLCIVGADIKEIKPNGTLASIAPTMLKLMGEDIPNEMEAEPLV